MPHIVIEQFRHLHLMDMYKSVISIGGFDDSGIPYIDSLLLDLTPNSSNLRHYVFCHFSPMSPEIIGEWNMAVNGDVFDTLTYKLLAARKETYVDQPIFLYLGPAIKTDDRDACLKLLDILYHSYKSNTRQHDCNGSPKPFSIKDKIELTSANNALIQIQNAWKDYEKANPKLDMPYRDFAKPFAHFVYKDFICNLL